MDLIRGACGHARLAALRRACMDSSNLDERTSEHVSAMVNPCAHVEQSSKSSLLSESRLWRTEHHVAARPCRLAG